MAIRNPHLEQLRRLELKTLESRFLTEIRDGLNCSPFESDAVLQVARETFFPSLEALQNDNVSNPLPGRITLVVVSADEPAGKTLTDCEKTTVTLAIHRGTEDDRQLLEEGSAAFRRARIPALCQQALSQGGVLTREDLAWRIFFVGPRTISRDLKILRDADPDTVLPLRSNRHDIGPVLTHRVRIIELALEGKTFTEIRDIMRHSPEAIANYISTFTRVTQLKNRGLQTGQIAFLLRRGRGLIERYVDLLESCRKDKNRRYHLDELLLADGCGWTDGEGKKPHPKTSQRHETGRRSLYQSATSAASSRLQSRPNSEARRRIPAPRRPAHPRIMRRDDPQKSSIKTSSPNSESNTAKFFGALFSADDRPRRGQRAANTEMKLVILTLHHESDLEARLERKPWAELRRQRAVRMCREAYDQGALLSNIDLSLLLGLGDSHIASLLVAYKKETNQIVPRRTTLHDMGTGVTHKRIICKKRRLEGKDPAQVARETWHTNILVNTTGFVTASSKAWTRSKPRTSSTAASA